MGKKKAHAGREEEDEDEGMNGEVGGYLKTGANCCLAADINGELSVLPVFKIERMSLSACVSVIFVALIGVDNVVFADVIVIKGAVELQL